MRIKTVFVAYPYRLGEGYRTALGSRFEGSGVELRYADERLENSHVMDKIRRMMTESDVSCFDITGSNPNVMLELGYALGAEEPGFVVVQEDAVDEISADITGWDQLRYKDAPDLADKLYDRITTGRVPQRVVVPTTKSARETVSILREMRFGVPSIDAPSLCVYLIPLDYDRHYKERGVFGTPPYRARDLCSSITSAMKYDTFFWSTGFDYSDHAGPDFIEVFEGRSSGRQSDRVTNFRVYLSGSVTYMQRLREGGAKHTPFLYLYMVEQVTEMALLAMSDVRNRLGFESQGKVGVGAILLGAEELRVSEATPDFYPAGDVGRELVMPTSEVWLPDEPLVLDGTTLNASAKGVAAEIAADLRTKLN